MGSKLYAFAYTPQALAYLAVLQPKLRKQIINRINALASDALPPNARVVQTKVDGQYKVYRIRSGVYRVLYSIRQSPDQIVILDIDHRKDVYR